MFISDVFGNLPALETERLILRKLRPEDDRDVFDYASNPEVSKQVVWDTHESIEDSRSFIAAVMELYENGEVATWGIEHRESGKLIGTAGFAYWNIPHARAEIGYALGERYWGRGYMTEAARAMLDFGFNTMGLNRIEARCELENRGSERVMEKIGMSLEGVIRQHMYVKGSYRDLKLYSILRSEWLV